MPHRKVNPNKPVYSAPDESNVNAEQRRISTYYLSNVRSHEKERAFAILFQFAQLRFTQRKPVTHAHFFFGKEKLAGKCLRSRGRTPLKLAVLNSKGQVFIYKIVFSQDQYGAHRMTATRSDGGKKIIIKRDPQAPNRHVAEVHDGYGITYETVGSASTEALLHLTHLFSDQRAMFTVQSVAIPKETLRNLNPRFSDDPLPSGMPYGGGFTPAHVMPQRKPPSRETSKPTWQTRRGRRREEPVLREFEGDHLPKPSDTPPPLTEDWQTRHGRRREEPVLRKFEGDHLPQSSDTPPPLTEDWQTRHGRGHAKLDIKEVHGDSFVGEKGGASPESLTPPEAEGKRSETPPPLKKDWQRRQGHEHKEPDIKEVHADPLPSATENESWHVPKGHRNAYPTFKDLNKKPLLKEEPSEQQTSSDKEDDEWLNVDDKAHKNTRPTFRDLHRSREISKTDAAEYLRLHPKVKRIPPWLKKQGFKPFDPSPKKLTGDE
jgi:hypothetical protein